MDLLDKAVRGDIADLDAIALAKLYDYDIYELGSAAYSIRESYFDRKVFFNINRPYKSYKYLC